MLRKAYFVSENKPINQVYKELVGNILDEYDDDEIEYEILDDNTFRINGNMSIHDFEKIVKITIPEGDYDTISGYLIDQLGRIPKDKEKPVIETENATYKIEKYKDQRIYLIKVCKNNPKPEEKDEEDDDGKE